MTDSLGPAGACQADCLSSHRPKAHVDLPVTEHEDHALRIGSPTIECWAFARDKMTTNCIPFRGPQRFRLPPLELSAVDRLAPSEPHIEAPLGEEPQSLFRAGVSRLAICSSVILFDMIATAGTPIASSLPARPD